MIALSIEPVEAGTPKTSTTVWRTWSRESRNTPASIAMCASSRGLNPEPAPAVRLAKRLQPEGGDHDPLADTGLTRLLAATLKHAQTAGQVRLHDDARDLWHDAYRQLARPLPGVPGQITARGEAHTIRVALTYALADGQRQIGPAHLKAALALHDYAARSAAWALAGATGQPLADRSTPRYATTRPA